MKSLSREKSKLNEVVKTECGALLGTASAVAEELGVELAEAILILILRELVILNMQVRELRERLARQGEAGG